MLRLTETTSEPAVDSVTAGLRVTLLVEQFGEPASVNHGDRDR